MRLWRGSSKRGQSMVEFAIILPIIFMLIVLLIDVTRIVYTWGGIHFAVSSVADRAASGETEAGQTRENSIAGWITGITTNLSIPNVTVTFTDKSGGATAGASAEFFSVKAQTALTLFPVTASLLALTGGTGKLTMSAETAVRNENF